VTPRAVRRRLAHLDRIGGQGLAPLVGDAVDDLRRQAEQRHGPRLVLAIASKRRQHRFADDADASDDDSVVVEHRILLPLGAWTLTSPIRRGAHLVRF